MFRVKLISISVLSLFAVACTSTSGGGKARIPETAFADDSYAPALKRWTRQSHVYDQFQKRLDAHAVIFTDEMRRAFLTRWKMLHGDNGSGWDDLDGGKLGIFISSFTPTYAYSKLEDSQIWSVQLSWGDRKIAPQSMRHLSKKAQFEPYFPFITNWSNEYLFLFDVNQSELGESQSTVIPTEVKLEMKSALAAVEFIWK